MKRHYYASVFGQDHELVRYAGATVEATTPEGGRRHPERKRKRIANMKLLVRNIPIILSRPDIGDALAPSTKFGASVCERSGRGVAKAGLHPSPRRRAARNGPKRP